MLGKGVGLLEIESCNYTFWNYMEHMLVKKILSCCFSEICLLSAGLDKLVVVHLMVEEYLTIFSDLNS